ncbi:DUF6412 domain-containing protein [Nocardia sp. alder85J]|uniref:DUF6412 domain-containing protein n=1 Tax=Nocardia sp. alder85J TaxID=2862949 RepID=UPI001CD38CDD|nr:DUF6412 domain-containing protein [Nocardia sp. alder85J]MCX4092057.1 DUF6412 domain-containing protein [Nocardia sp. alder85J]
MMTRIRSAALMLCAMIVSGWAAVLLPASEPNALLAMSAAALLALAVAAAQPHRMTPLPVAVCTGPPGSAQRRRRGSFLRQSNPDTAGRARPRAPGREG